MTPRSDREMRRARAERRSKREARRRAQAARRLEKTKLRAGGVPQTSYVPIVESKPGELLRKWDIINHLIKLYGYTRYLEIGVCGYDLHGRPQDGETFKRVECLLKDGVDPAGDPANYHMTSDEFFDEMGLEDEPEYDIIFIDADHRPRQVMKDFKNAQNRLSNNGAIIFHDAYPDPECFGNGHIIGGGNGSVWRTVAEINLTMPEWTVWTLALDGGMGIIRRKPRATTPDFSIPLNEITMFDVPKYAKVLLNLITIDEFKEIFK